MSQTLNRQELARRLREAREVSGLKQEEVARHLHLSRPTVAQIELGNRAVSSLELDQLARLYGRDIRDFFAAEFLPEESLMALFRAEPDVARDEIVGAVSVCIALARELSSLESALGLDRSQLRAPAYPIPPPRSKWQAVEQGMRFAAEERRRLGLGLLPLVDTAELLESQGVRTATVELPEDISGLTLMEPSLGLFVVANRRHAILRRRFSWIHEYAHVLLDRGRKGTISRMSERDELPEVRANAFAAAFLMPEEGVREFLANLGKGQPSRERLEIFDGMEAVPAEIRSEPGSQSLQLYDVVLLASHFGMSREAALFRLRNLHLISQAELDRLRAEEKAGKGKQIARLLALPEPEHTAAREEFRSRFLALALEALRRGKISRGKLRELAGMVHVGEESLDQLLEDSGLSEPEGPLALVPEGLA